ncbi:TPA: hypothetical protein RG419_003597 [Morganella morganii]|nr:hypothetical protein [Morganella morganii]
MKYYYTQLTTEKTNTQANYITASEILRKNNLTPFQYKTKKHPYMQTTVYILNRAGEKLGFIQESISGTPALLTTYKKMK